MRKGPYRALLMGIVFLLSGCTVKDFGMYAGKTPVHQVNFQFANQAEAIGAGGVADLEAVDANALSPELVAVSNKLVSGLSYGVWLSFKPIEDASPPVVVNATPPAAPVPQLPSDSLLLATNLYNSCIDAMAKGNVQQALSDCKVAAKLNPKYERAFQHALAMSQRRERDLANIPQFRQQIIRPALKRLGAYNRDAEELILATIIHESLAGAYLKQIKGPALGYCQMEPATHDDIWQNFLSRPDKRKYAITFKGKIEAARLATDTFYAVQMCRLHYMRFTSPLPKHNDINAIAQYWKKYFNTHKGKGRITDFIRHYKEHTQ